jgi:hypothetical protein
MIWVDNSDKRTAVKPKAYVQKYALDQSDSFDREEFIADLSQDFMAVIEYLQGANQLSHSRFLVVVSDIRNKFNAIKAQSKTPAQVWEQMWTSFHSSVIKSSETKLFGDYLRAQEKRNKARERDRINPFASYRDFADEWASFAAYFLAALSATTIPTSSFTELGLEPSASAEDVKAQFKKLALIHHPDCGGSQQKMVQIIEAKNRCLAYSSRTSP